MELKLAPGKVLLVLLTSIAAIVTLHIFFTFLAAKSGNDNFFGILPVFNVREETNIPTLFSSVQMLLCSAMLFVITALHKGKREPYVAWMILAIIFLGLALDETAMIHEKIGSKVHDVWEPTGYLRYAWVIPYGLGLIVFVTLYSKFLLNLPRRIMWLFIISGSIYVAGAIGMEMMTANINDYRETMPMHFEVQEVIEESLEMIGIALFAFSLVSYLQLTFPGASLAIAPASEQAARVRTSQLNEPAKPLS